MSTLVVVEEVLRRTRTPMSVREIVEAAGAALPTKSRTPDTVVARDLSVELKHRGAASLFARVSAGRYTLREFVAEPPCAAPLPEAPVASPMPEAPTPPAEQL